MPRTQSQISRTESLKDEEEGPVLKQEEEKKVDKTPDCAASPRSDPGEQLSSQSAEIAAHFLQICESPRLTQDRPSVLRSTSTSLLPRAGHTIFSQPDRNPVLWSRVKEAEFNSLTCTNQHTALSSQPISVVHPELFSSLFVSGRCRWPGCDQAFEDYTAFLKHLNDGHSCGEKSIAQWRVQQERVRHMETQLFQETQRLYAMQLHLRLSENPSGHARAALGWSVSEEADGRVESVSEAAAGRQERWPTLTPHLLSDFVSSLECYKYVNIRPPYTYAFLIRWSILESPDKQRALNEIYNWFIRMFFYFRHNTPTWKNAVRHNLSLHKCFVRVDGSKGAVWTVDEGEFQKRKGQKFTRDSAIKWITPFSHPSQVA